MVMAAYTLVLGVHRAQANRSVVHNALIESSLVNARALAYFLSNNVSSKDEVTAFDFLPEGTWDRAVARKDLGELIGDISNHLSHAKHVDEPAPWALIEIAERVIGHMNRFVEAVRQHDKERAGRFEARIVPLTRNLDHARDLAKDDEDSPQPDASAEAGDLSPRTIQGSVTTSTTQSLG